MPQSGTNDYVRGGTQKQTYKDEDVLRWACPLCKASDGRLLKKERGVLGVVQCQDCGLIRVDPRLRSPEEIYQGDGTIYQEEYRPVVEHGKPHHRDWNYRRVLDLLEDVKPTGALLDVGSGAGAFLRLAMQRRWTITSVEPSATLAALARQWFGLDVVVGKLEEVELPDSSFDIVTMTDVFEHVVNPREVLAAARRVLKSDGYLFIKVPNARYNLLKFRARAALGKTQSDDFDAYEHVLHYTDKTLRLMLRKGGFEPVITRIEPPVQLPTWHDHVGHYYQNASPWILDWKRRTARTAMFLAAQVETRITRGTGTLAPNIGCLARPL